MRSKVCVKICPYLNHPIGKGQNNEVRNMHAWFSFLLSVLSARDWNVEFILIRFLPLVLQCMGYATIKNQSKQDALLPLKCVGYATEKNQSKQDASLLLKRVGYATVKNQSKQNALFLLKRVGYATIKNQSKQDALLPLKFKCHWKNCKQALACAQQN